MSFKYISKIRLNTSHSWNADYLPMNLLSSSSVSSVAFLIAARKSNRQPGRPMATMAAVVANPSFGSPLVNSNMEPVNERSSEEQ